jgi:hypothetical protein
MCRSTIALIAVAMSLAISIILAADNNPFQAGDEHAANPAQPIAKARTIANVASNSGAVEDKIRETLEQKTDLEYGDTPIPLNEVIEFIKDKHHIAIVLNQKALKDGGFDPTVMMVNKTLRDISLRSALRMILQEFNLTYFVKDEVLQITTKETASSTLVTRMYDVRDLTAPDKNVPDPMLLNQLIDVIDHTIDPETWKTDKNTGEGAIRSFCNNDICVLVVFQTYEVHDRIADLLDELRTHKSPKTAKE